jgi:predicted dehydrogenase
MISNDFVHAMMRKGQQPNVVRAVATSKSLERAKQFIAKLKVPEKEKEAIRAYGNYDELLADPEIGLDMP